MHKFSFLFLLFVHISIASAFAQKKPMSLPKLQHRILARLTKVEGDFAVAFKNLSNPDEELLINERESFHAASTMKTPVMIEVYKQAAAGKFALTDSILVKNKFKSIVDDSLYSMDISEDGGEALYRKIGQKVSIYDLVYDMITVSSNLATNILIDLVDARKANQTMRELGAMDIQVLRGVEDDKAYQKGLNNTTTAYDLMLIYEKLAHGKDKNIQSHEEMIKILLNQQFREIIPDRLPKEVKVAHKTGSITGVRHDSGIVYLPDGRRYVLVLLSKELKNPDKGVKAMAKVSRMIYKYMTQKGKK